jgi:DNA-binding ferritin-like protein
MVKPAAHSAKAAQQDPRAQRLAMLELSLARLRRATWVLSGFSFVLLVLTVVTWMVALRMWGTLSEAEQLAERLGNLGDFEKRVVSRLDNVNVGVQSLIKETSERVEQVRSEAEKATKLARESGDRITAVADRLDMRMNSFALQSDGEAMPDFGEDSQPVTRSAPGRTPDVDPAETAEAASPSEGSKSFRRVTNADGTVTYEKIR